MYSQHNEEQIILDYFNNPGHKSVFLDIGAYDGICISNTYQLWKNGWHGIYVEASPTSVLYLQNNIPNNCQIFNIAVVEDSNKKIVKFYDNKENATFVNDKNEIHKIKGVSTTCKNHVYSWQQGYFKNYHKCEKVEFSEIFVGSCTISDIIQNIDSHIAINIEFLDLDIEGTNLAIARTIPFDRLPNLKLLCVEKETDDPMKNYSKIFESYNFSFFAETYSNLFFAKKLNI